MYWVIIKKFLVNVPKKVWIGLGGISLLILSFYFYGNHVEAKTEARVVAEYTKAYDKALQDDLRMIKEDLSDAITTNKKLEQRALQVGYKSEQYEKEVGKLNEELEKLRNRDIDCRVIDPEYNSLLKSILQTPEDS